MKFIGALMTFFLVLTSCAMAEPQSLPTIQIAVMTPDLQSHIFTVEVANTPETRRDGLMGRTELPPDRGMIFVFQNEGVLGFWMKNTLIPLDMLFIGAGGRVLKVHENAQPHDLSVISSGLPVRWAIEIAGGRAKTLGITAGSVVTSASLRFD